MGDVDRLLILLRLTSGPGVATPALWYSRWAAVSVDGGGRLTGDALTDIGRLDAGDTCPTVDTGRTGVGMGWPTVDTGRGGDAGAGLGIDTGAPGAGEGWLAAEFGGVGSGDIWVGAGAKIGAGDCCLAAGCGMLTAGAGCCPGVGRGRERTAGCGLVVGVSSIPGGKSRSAGCSKTTLGGMAESWMYTLQISTSAIAPHSTHPDEPFLLALRRIDISFRRRSSGSKTYVGSKYADQPGGRGLSSVLTATCVCVAAMPCIGIYIKDRKKGPGQVAGQEDVQPQDHPSVLKRIDPCTSKANTY